MHLRVNLKFLGEILVHPVRRQNFAGTGAPYILQHLRLCHTRIFINTIKIETRACVCAREGRAFSHRQCGASGNVFIVAEKKNCGGKFSLLFLFFSSEWCKPSRDNQHVVNNAAAAAAVCLQIKILQNTQI